MGVAYNVASGEKLRRSVVGCICIGERAGYEVGGLHGDVEGCVALDVFASGERECDHAGDHIGLCGDISHS